MQAAVITEIGTAPVKRSHPDPAPSPGTTLVRVRAAALNTIDGLIASGRHPVAVPAVPYVPGIEGAGDVLASDTFAVGTRVRVAAAGGRVDGTVAELVSAPDGSCVAIPDELDYRTAAAIGTVGTSALLTLRERAHLEVGSSVLVLGATGPFGLAFVQLARLLGASRVIAAGRDESRLAAAAAAGATEVVTLHSDAPQRLLEDVVAIGGPVNVVIDPLWGSFAPPALAALTPGGRYVNVGQEAGVTAPLDGGLLRHAGRVVTGFSGTTASAEAIAGAYLEIAQYARAGTLRLPIREYPLASIHDAWNAQLNSPGAKIILLPDA